MQSNKERMWNVSVVAVKFQEWFYRAT